MRAPRFWYQPRGGLAILLSPLGGIYGCIGRILRARTPPQHFPVPIISIGNIVAGGAGKTPTALALATLLQGKGLKVHFATRGYGGTLQGPLKVNPSHHTAREVGEEALLLASQAPTWVGKKRALAVQKACEEKPDLIILDDGHQTIGVHKDLSFVVVDSLQGFGNGCVIPAGPLRESYVEGIKRADALIAIGAFSQSIPFELNQLPVFEARVVPVPFPTPIKQGIAFCGLGFPQKFFNTLEIMGINLIKTLSFPDHYFYRKKDLSHLESVAHSHQVPLLTTRKDWVKLPLAWQKRVHVLDIAVQFDGLDQLYDFICRKIPSLRAPHA